MNSYRVKLTAPAVSETNRAWTEINLAALKHNVGALQKLLPGQCGIMAVVKANAYGHGDIAVAKALESYGVHAFAVATLEEGITLRRNGIKGDILILGYTSPDNLDCLVYYRLIQTVVDEAYAGILNAGGKKIRVHIKIDTGMHRLGIDSHNITGLESIFRYGNLVIEGIYSHLNASDSLTKEDVDYTRLQIDRFFYTVNTLKSMGYQTGKLHLTASYGILNYPGLPCDYARAGIALYGVLSGKGATLRKIDLRPVLSIRARVATVRRVVRGDCIGYGRQYTADKDMKIAVVAIGYADGIPRNLSKPSAYVLLHGQKAPVIGRVCMDQLAVDVTPIDSAKAGDIATVIGRDGNECIRCEDMAEECGTISNEILSRLGSRLNYIYTS